MAAGRLGVPEEVRQATEGYRAEMDVLAAFLEDCCVLEPRAATPARDLYEAYRAWCETSGERWASHKAFSLRLKERGLASERVGRDKVHTWLGVGLATGRGSIEGPRPDAARCFGMSALSGPCEAASGTIEPHRAAAADRAAPSDGDDWGVV